MKILVDIGSTIIKCVQTSDEGEVIAHQYHDRDYGQPVGDQVTQILGEQDQNSPAGETRICSSANGADVQPYVHLLLE